MNKPTIDELEARIAVIEATLKYFQFGNKPMLDYGKTEEKEDES